MNCIHKLFVLMLLAAMVVAVTGCMTENEHGCCEPPKENLEWFYIEEQAPLLGSNKWCVVCDASIADKDVLDWLKANAYSGRDPSFADDEYWEVDEDGLLPCLFASTDREGAAGCQSAICQSDLGFNDPVWPGFGPPRELPHFWGDDGVMSTGQYIRRFMVISSFDS